MKSVIVSLALASSLLIGPASYAQVIDEPPADDNGVDAPATETPAPPVAVPVFPLAYFQMAENMPFGDWETRLGETLRMYRLGVMTLADAQEQLRELKTAALVTAAQLRTLTPPPQFAHVQELNIAAASEYAASFESGMASLNGDQGARATANDHFSRAQDLAYQARQELR